MEKSITRLIELWKTGDIAAENAICQAIWPKIRNIAKLQLAHKSQRTLRATQLADDVFLELRNSSDAFANSSQLMSLAARMVRLSIMDHIRERLAQKRGRDFEIVSLDYAVDVTHSENTSSEDWLLLEQALAELESIDARAAKLVELRYFAGMTVDEAAKELQISEATATRIWRFARAHLIQKLGNSGLAP
jgi:RNA polymerase sigma factor (TIGR02999 family)